MLWWNGMEWVGHSSKWRCSHSKRVQTVSLLRHHRRIIAPGTRDETIQPRVIMDGALSYALLIWSSLINTLAFQDDLSIPSDFDGMYTSDSALHECSDSLDPRSHAHGNRLIRPTRPRLRHPSPSLTSSSLAPTNLGNVM